MLRGELLTPQPPPEQQRRISLGDELDLKFRNALTWELDGESVAVQFFRRPREQTSRLFGWLRRSYYPGDLLTATNRRLLWITDRYRGHYERYGSIARYVALHNIADCRLNERPHNPKRQRGDGLEVVVELRSGRLWVIPAHGASREARQFELEAGRLFAEGFR